MATIIVSALNLVQNLIPKIASPNLSDVVDCYEHAVLATFPRGRYMPGRSARYLWWPLSKAPEWLFDFLMNADPNLPIPASIKQLKS